MMQTTTPRNDMLARLTVFVLFDIALFVSFDPAIAQSVLLPLILAQSISLTRCLKVPRFIHRAERVPVPNQLRFAIMKRDRYRCKLCGRSASNGIKLEVDHKLPVARGGTNNPSNLWTLCNICNSGKSDSLL